MKKILTNQKGTAILIALSLIAMLVAVGIMSVDRSTTDIELSYNKLHEEQSFYGAEAGIARAMVLINSDTTWRGPILKEKLDNTEYTVIVLDSLWNPALIDTLIIRSTSNNSGSASGWHPTALLIGVYILVCLAFGSTMLYKVWKTISLINQCDRSPDIMSEIEDWNPGIMKGQRVAVKMVLPIIFKLNRDG